MSDQGELFSGAPKMHPVERRRLTSQAQRMLAILQEREITTPELAGISLQYNARIFELRRAGYRIKMVKREIATGVNTYALEEP